MLFGYEDWTMKKHVNKCCRTEDAQVDEWYDKKRQDKNENISYNLGVAPNEDKLKETT